MGQPACMEKQQLQGPADQLATPTDHAAGTQRLSQLNLSRRLCFLNRNRLTVSLGFVSVFEKMFYDDIGFSFFSKYH